MCVIVNDRYYQAIQTLLTGEGCARDRVTVACEILSKLHSSELPPDLQSRLASVLNEASKKGPLKSPDGVVIRGAFENTKIGRRNKTYSNLAREIDSIWKELNVRVKS